MACKISVLEGLEYWLQIRFSNAMTESIELDRLTGIIAFARAASLGSYRAAARSLSLSPSAVSKSVQRLEARLGLKLFSRTTRSLTLTQEGLELFDRAQRLLGEAEAIEQMALAARAGPSGVLKITAAVPIGTHVLAPYLSRFRERYPNVIIDLRLSDTVTDLVEEGIDVAVRVGPLADSRLIARKLAANRVCAFASPAYLKTHGTPQHPDDLSSHQCVNVRFKSSGQELRWPFSLNGESRQIAPQAGIIIDNTEAVATVIASGGGIGISPTFVAAAYVARGELVPVLAEYWVEPNDITALWPESRRGNPTVQAFVAFLDEVFTQPAPWNVTVFGGSV